MDARSHVRAGLLRLVAIEGMPVTADAAWRNRLLDEVGSDHRQLVAVLCVAHAAPALQAMLRPAPNLDWQSARRLVVEELVVHLAVARELAPWAADTWAIAGGLTPEPAVMTAMSEPLQRSGVRVGPKRRSAPPPPASTASGRQGLPSWVKPGKVPNHPRWSSASSPSPRSPGFQYFSRLEKRTALFVGLLYFGSQLFFVLQARKSDAAAFQRVAAPRPAPAPALVAVPVTPSIVPAPVAPRPLADTVILHSGLRLTGQIQLITEERVRIRDEASQLIVEQPLSNVTSIVSRTGRRFDAALLQTMTRDSLAALPDHALPDGDFRVVVTPRRIDGDTSCQLVWQHMPRAHVETRHISRDSLGDYTLQGAPAIRWRPQKDGWFEASPVTAERNGVAYRFDMTGRVLGNRIVARTRTTTTSVIRWRDTQSCHIVSELTATPLNP